MSPKPDVSEARREQILDAAETVFGQRGFNEARMDDIVAEAGLSKGALYWYYKSKDAIILALLDRVFGGEFRRAKQLIDEPISASAKLTSFMKSVMEDISRMRHLLPIGYEFVALAARRKPVREAIGGYYRQYQELLAELIHQGIDSGEFRQMDADEAAMFIVAQVEGLALMWFVIPDWLDLKALGDRPMRSLLEGFVNPDPAQHRTS